MTTPSSALLPDLQKLVLRLLEDLKERAVENKDVDTKLRGVFALHQKQNRTAQAYEMWRTDELEQVAVAWVLGCVFIRFLEDNDLLGKTYLAGEGSRQEDADAFHSAYFRQNPVQSDRDFFYHVFGEMKKIPALKDLFSENRTPLWLVGPSGDGASALRQFWMEKDPNTGKLNRSFVSPDWDTRFLGDLYQDLSAHVRARYALLQTPDFVESFILDYTLDPAIDDFGLSNFRMIDPTCGSGHFLLGAFHRLLDRWLKQEPGQNITQTVKHTLAAIHGVDINPYAVAIARFRLTLTALRACEISQLKNAPYFELNLAAGDSLMFGNRRTYDGRTFGPEFALFDDTAVLQNLFISEDRKEAHAILSKEFHAVVGNPPYITVKDGVLAQEYRRRFSTCHRQYSLCIPFIERFTELAAIPGDGSRPGYIGLIIANSFMKREFGKKLIEDFFPRIEITHIIDTSGAYIPGHGTPTAILFIRKREALTKTLKAVLGIRGEPSTPTQPDHGIVWRSIVDNLICSNFQNEFISVSIMDRSRFHSHPWAIGGGGAADLKAILEEKSVGRLSEFIDLVGYVCMTRADDVYCASRESLARNGIPSSNCIESIDGEVVRDWTIHSPQWSVFPYDVNLRPITQTSDDPVIRFLWPHRTHLWLRKEPNGNHREIGLSWYEWSRFQKERFRNPLSISFAEIASHNHFVLDRGGKVFKQTAPVIKLPEHASEDDHLALLGLLNSSTACFWMKQVSHQKQMMGGDGIRISEKAKVPYQFAGTRMGELPIPNGVQTEKIRDRLIKLTRLMEAYNTECGSLSAEKSIGRAIVTGRTIASVFAEFEARRTELRARMVFLQEEIDFSVYVMFGLVNESCLLEEQYWSVGLSLVGERPFEIIQQRNIDGYEVPSSVPTEWPDSIKELWNKRISAIDNSPELKLIENPHYKRRWIGRQGLFNHAARSSEVEIACEAWMLDRVEEKFRERAQEGTLEILSSNSVAELVSSDEDFLLVASEYCKRPDPEIASIIGKLASRESVPVVPSFRFKETGLEKHNVWKNVWSMQRKEDAGERNLSIPEPPKYAATNYRSADFMRLRGKLDVPKERFVSFPGSERAGDSSLPIAWAGWNHLELATAIAGYYTRLKEEESDAKDKLVPLLVAIHELVPWLLQWHNEFNDEFQQRMGDFYNEFVLSESVELGLTRADLENWKPAQTKPSRKRTKKNGGEE